MENIKVIIEVSEGRVQCIYGPPDIALDCDIYDLDSMDMHDDVQTEAEFLSDQLKKEIKEYGLTKVWEL